MCKIKVYSSYYNLRHLYTCTSFALHWVKIQYLSTSYRWFFSLKIYNIIKVLQLKFDVRFKKTMHGWRFDNNQCTTTVQGKLSILMKGWLTFEFVTFCICIYYSMYEVFLWQWVASPSDPLVETLYLHLKKDPVLLQNVYTLARVHAQNVNVFREMNPDS